MPAAIATIQTPDGGRDQPSPRFMWGTKWGTKSHVAQPISAESDFAKTV
jgi:hypothetical protein